MRKSRGAALALGDGAIRQIGAARPAKARCSAWNSAQRVDMTVIRGPRRAGHRGAEARQHRRQLVAVEHAVVEAEIAGLAPHLLHHRPALRDFLGAEAELQAAVLLEPDIDPGALAELGRERRPCRGRGAGPALVMRRAEPFALHPDEAEIAARGAKGDIALVDQRDLRARRAPARSAIAVPTSPPPITIASKRRIARLILPRAPS